MKCNTSLLHDPVCAGASKLCLPERICICNPGYITMDAFSTNSKRICNIHEDAIKGLGIIETLLSSIYNLIILRHLVKRMLVAKTFKVFFMDGKTFCAFIFLLIGVSDIILALSYQTYQQKKIYQNDALVAVSSALFTFFCFVGLSLYFQILLNFLRDSSILSNAKSRNKVISRLTVMQRFSWAVVPLSIPISLSPTFILIYKNHAMVFAMTSVIGIGCLLFLYAMLYFVALGFMIKELSVHIDNSKDILMTGESHDLNFVLRKLNSAYYIGGGCLLSGSTAMVLFGSYDFLYEKFAYLSSIVRINGIFALTLMHLTIAGVPAPPLDTTKKISFVTILLKRYSSVSLEKRILPIELHSLEKT